MYTHSATFSQALFFYARSRNTLTERSYTTGQVACVSNRGDLKLRAGNWRDTGMYATLDRSEEPFEPTDRICNFSASDPICITQNGVTQFNHHAVTLLLGVFHRPLIWWIDLWDRLLPATLRRQLSLFLRTSQEDKRRLKIPLIKPACWRARGVILFKSSKEAKLVTAFSGDSCKKYEEHLHMFPNNEQSLHKADVACSARERFLRNAHG